MSGKYDTVIDNDTVAAADVGRECVKVRSTLIYVNWIIKLMRVSLKRVINKI